MAATPLANNVFVSEKKAIGLLRLQAGDGAGIQPAEPLLQG